MTINEEKLQKEFKDANIPIDGFNSEGVIWFKGEATQDQINQGYQILKNHTPDWYVTDRRSAYKPLPEQLDMLYHDKVNGTNNWFNHIQQVKTTYPKT